MNFPYIVPSEEQKRYLLSALTCNESDTIYQDILNFIRFQKPIINDFKCQNPKKASKQQEEVAKIAGQAKTLLKSLNELKHNKDLLQHLFKLNCYLEFEKLPNISLMDSVHLINESLNDAYDQIDPKNIKDPISRGVVEQLLPILKKHGFPTGKDNPRFHEVLRVVFELLSLEGKDSFENVIRTVKEKMKKGGSFLK